jgi:hypothetical protein
MEIYSWDVYGCLGDGTRRWILQIVRGEEDLDSRAAVQLEQRMGGLVVDRRTLVDDNPALNMH